LLELTKQRAITLRGINDLSGYKELEPQLELLYKTVALTDSLIVVIISNNDIVSGCKE
jgi:hypothetical protein